MIEKCHNCGNVPVNEKYRGWKMCEGCGQAAEREMAEQAKREADTFLRDLDTHAARAASEAEELAEMICTAEYLWENRPLYQG